MKGKLIFVIILTFLPVYGQSLDFAFQYYAPTLFGISSGKAAPLARFEDHESDYRFLIPLETKVLALRFGAFALSGNVVISPYLENSAFSSLNISLGGSLYLNRRISSPMRGWHLSLYPLYELPLLTDGKQPLFAWRAALDLGYSLDLGPISLSAFSRYMAAWSDSAVSFWPDLGVAVGVHFR